MARKRLLPSKYQAPAGLSGDLRIATIVQPIEGMLIHKVSHYAG